MSSARNRIVVPAMVFLVLACTREAKRDRAIRASFRETAEIIRTKPRSQEAGDSLRQSWKLLFEKYPQEKFKSSEFTWARDENLRAAIAKGRPFVIAFAPKVVHGDGEWDIPTEFRELAGQRAVIDQMSPVLRKRDGTEWVLPDRRGLVGERVVVQAFGTTFHEWSCRGDLDGASASLIYQHEHGDVVSGTKLAQKK